MTTKQLKFKAVNLVLWAAYILALFASVNHLAWAFGRLEFTAWVGWIPALAVDFGLAALAYAIQQRKRAKRQTRMLWLGVIAFSVISAFANLLHAVAVVSDAAVVTLEVIRAVDALTLTKAVVLSASLPLLVVYLGEIVSSDDAEAAKAAEREMRRLERIEEAVTEREETPAPVAVEEIDTSQAAARPKTALTLNEFLATVAASATGEFGPGEAAEWAGLGRTATHGYLKRAVGEGHIEQTGRGQYRYRNGVEG